MTFDRWRNDHAATTRSSHPAAYWTRYALQAASGAFLPAVLLLFIAFAAKDAAAQITEIRVDQIDNSSGGPPLEGFVTNDVAISFSGQYTGSQLLVVLDQGSIYQDPDGDITVPEFTSASVEFDTFVTHGLPAISDITYGLMTLSWELSTSAAPIRGRLTRCS